MKKQKSTIENIAKVAKESTINVQRTLEYKELRAKSEALQIGFRDLQEDEKGLNFKCKRIIESGLFLAEKPADLINIVKKYARYRNSENQIVKPLYLYRENGTKYILFVECEYFSYPDIFRAICNYNMATSMYNQNRNTAKIVGKWADADGKELDTVMIETLEREYDVEKLFTYDPRPETVRAKIRERMNKDAEKLAQLETDAKK